MFRWEAARQQGNKLTPEELGGSDPALVAELRRRIRAVLAMEDLMGVTEVDPRRTRVGTHEGNAEPEPLPIIPGYEVIRVIDRGGMGIVYEARHLKLGRTVAIKMIVGAHLRPKIIARFRLEAKAAARLQHPNFVQIFEDGQVNGRPYFAMEYVGGGSLADLLTKQALLPGPAAELLETLARAVHAAHQLGIVHRDLKPSNVMLSADGTPKIADFGLAKHLDDDSSHTHTGEVLGTPSYMAPEQAEGKKDLIGPATDVYALGAILYELLSGVPPFQGASPLDSLRLVVAQEPLPPSRLAPAVPRDLEAICLKCLEKAPGQRYDSALALADDLRRFRDGQPVTARHLGRFGRAWKLMRRHPQAVALWTTLVVLALIPAVVLINQLHTERTLRKKALEQAPIVRDILRRNCYECHGQDPTDVQKNLDILNHQQLLDSARRIVVPESPENSRLIQRIADGSMPPEEDEIRLPRVSENELVILTEWIRGGAPPFPLVDAAPIDLVPAPHAELAAKTKAIFHDRCYKCHKFSEAKGGIKILHHRLLVAVRKVVIPGQPDESELFQLLGADDNTRMPPIGYDRLSREEIATIRAWILAGAPPFPKND